MNGDARSLLLQMMAPGGGDVAPPGEEVFSQIEQQNPLAALVARYLASRRADADQAEEAEEGDFDEADLLRRMTQPTAASKQPAVERRRLRGRVRALAAELAQVRATTCTLAAALGACRTCWGADPSCPRCEGAGGPGAFAPDARLYEELVLPAVRRMQARAEADASLASRQVEPARESIEETDTAKE